MKSLKSREINLLILVHRDSEGKRNLPEAVAKVKVIHQLYAPKAQQFLRNRCRRQKTSSFIICIDNIGAPAFSSISQNIFLGGWVGGGGEL